MDQRRLLEDLLTSFDEAGFRALCLRLGIVHKDLKGWDRADKAAALVRAMSRAVKLDLLADAMVSERPDLGERYGAADQLAWLDEVAVGLQLPVDEDVTLEWPITKEELGSRTDEQRANYPSTRPVDEGPTMAWPDGAAKWAPPAGGATSNNPYRAGGALKHSAMFFGRAAERSQITARLQRLVSVAVTGSRRTGKSWLCHYLNTYERYPPDSKLLFAAVDGSRSAIETAADMYDTALAGWYGHLLDAPPPTADSPLEFARQLRTLRGAGYKPILLLDEFDLLLDALSDNLEELIPAWERPMRAGHLALLVTSRVTVTELAGRFGLGDRFFGMFRQLVLGQLKDSEARSLVQEPALAEGLQIADSTTDYLLSLCGNHPYDLQLGMGLLFEALASGNYDQARHTLHFTTSAEPHWRGIWKALSPIERLALAQVLTGDTKNGLDTAFSSLKRLGLLVEDEKGIRCYGRGFAQRIGALVAQKE